MDRNPPAMPSDEIELESTGFAWILRGAASAYTNRLFGVHGKLAKTEMS